MIYDFALMAAAFLMVVKGGGWFVDASIAIARHFSWPRVLVGGTLVTLATTSPELIVSMTASASGQGGLALGNAVGSVIVNTGLIIGTVALLSPMVINPQEFRPRALWMLACAVLFVFCSWHLKVGRLAGLGLCAVAVIYLINDYFYLKSRPVQIEEAEENPKPILHQAFWFVLGAVLVVAGSRLMIVSAVNIAAKMGVSSIVIGLTLVAFGTSLPEFVTAVISARRNVSDLSIGNILAANIVNLTLVSGTSAAIRELPLNEFTRRYSYPAMFLLILILTAAFWKNGRAGCRTGILLLFIYVLYTAGLLIFQKHCGGALQEFLHCADFTV